MIRSRLAILLAEKGHRENRKMTYEAVMKDTGLSKGVLVRLHAQDFGASGTRVEVETIDKLCDYLGCGVGDILEHIPNGESK